MERKLVINKSDKIVYMQGAAPIICRSMSKPEDIVGFEIGDALIDEFDTLKTEHAIHAWNKIIARMRKKYPDGRANRVDVVTTPEGFKATYRKFVEDVHKKGLTNYSITHGSTYDNEANLPDDYIPSLLSTYPAELIEAYLDGQFTNLTSGSVYPSFDRTQSNSTEVVKKNDTLHVGMDFNVMKGAAAIHVERGDTIHAVDEIHNAFDTDIQIQTLKERYPNQPIIVYPDAAGKNRTSANTTQTDLVKLKAAKFRVIVPNKNPLIKERVASLNAKLLNGKDERTYFVNCDKCPNLANSYEQQVYDDNGQPDKSCGLDHIVDGAGYYIHKKWPIVRRKSGTIAVVGLY
jgi:hypothetical protein